MGIFMDIEDKAKEFLKENNAYQVPVRLDIIANNKNIDIVNISFADINKDIDGAIQMSSNKVTIFVEESNELDRKRFTIAHELGHFVYNREDGFKEVFFRNRKLFNEQEAKADYFAVALLMPKELIEEEYKKAKSALNKLEEKMESLKKEEILEEFLAEKFSVSRVILSKRLEDLGLI